MQIDCKGLEWLSAMKRRNRAQLKRSRLRPSSSGTTTLHRFGELKMLTFHLHFAPPDRNFFRFFNFENTVNFSMDSTAKFPDIRFSLSPGKIVQISCETSCSRENFLHVEHFRIIDSTYFRSAVPF